MILRVGMVAFAVLLVACDPPPPEDPCIPVIRLSQPLEAIGEPGQFQTQIQNAGIDDVRARMCVDKTIQCKDGTIDNTGFCAGQGGFLPTGGTSVGCPLGSVLDENDACIRCPPGFAATTDGTMCVPDTNLFNTCTPAGAYSGCYDSSRDAFGLPGFISAGVQGPFKSGACEIARNLANKACSERGVGPCKRLLSCDCACLKNDWGCACNVYGEYEPKPAPKDPFDPLNPMLPKAP